MSFFWQVIILWIVTHAILRILGHYNGTNGK